MSIKTYMKPTSVITANLGIQPRGPAHRYFTKRCADYMDKYLPFKRGGLAYDTRIIETDKIIYNSPYAHYMYEGKVMGPNIPIKKDGIVVGWFSKSPKYYTGKDINYNKSGGHEYAGPYWDKRMWSAEKENIIDEMKQYIRKFGGK